MSGRAELKFNHTTKSISREFSLSMLLKLIVAFSLWIRINGLVRNAKATAHATRLHDFKFPFNFTPMKKVENDANKNEIELLNKQIFDSRSVLVDGKDLILKLQLV